MRLGERIKLVVEVPRFSFVKRSADGTIDFVSPFPCPFNYGSVPGTVSGDGDPVDVVCFGRRLERGAECEAIVVGVVEFVDDGQSDPKYLCALEAPGSAFDRLSAAAFFVIYARVKSLLNRTRGRNGRTKVSAIRFATAEPR